MISTVSSIGGLDVISRTSVMGFKGTNKKVSEIGKELQVGSVLEGSVRKAGNKIRITVQQIETKTDRHIWSQTYDRNLDDIFAVQSEIARQVAEKLSVKILPQERKIIEKEHTRNPEAYLLYLRGRHYWSKRNKEGLLNAINYFERAIALDPNFALAYSGLADTYHLMADYWFMPREVVGPLSKRNASKAVELDDLSPEAHTSLAVALVKEYDWAAGERQFQRALELNPNYATAHHWYADYLLGFRRFNEALGEGLRAEQLDPLSPITRVFVGACFFLMKQLDLAQQKQEKTLEIWPDFSPAWVQLAIVHNTQGRYEELARDLDKMSSLGAQPNLLKPFRGILLAGLGRSDEARTILREMSETYSVDKLEVPFISLCLMLGEHEKAVQVALAAYEIRSDVLATIASDFNFENIRRDPRVQEVLKKIGLPP